MAKDYKGWFDSSSDELNRIGSPVPTPCSWTNCQLVGGRSVEHHRRVQRQWRGRGTASRCHWTDYNVVRRSGCGQPGRLAGPGVVNHLGLPVAPDCGDGIAGGSECAQGDRHRPEEGSPDCEHCRPRADHPRLVAPDSHCGLGDQLTVSIDGRTVSHMTTHSVSSFPTYPSGSVGFDSPGSVANVKNLEVTSATGSSSSPTNCREPGRFRPSPGRACVLGIRCRSSWTAPREIGRTGAVTSAFRRRPTSPPPTKVSTSAIRWTCWPPERAPMARLRARFIRRSGPTARRTVHRPTRRPMRCKRSRMSLLTISTRAIWALCAPSGRPSRESWPTTAPWSIPADSWSPTPPMGGTGTTTTAPSPARSPLNDIYYETLKDASSLAQALGRSHEADVLRQQAAALKHSINQFRSIRDAGLYMLSNLQPAVVDKMPNSAGHRLRGGTSSSMANSLWHGLGRSVQGGLKSIRPSCDTPRRTRFRRSGHPCISGADGPPSAPVSLSRRSISSIGRGKCVARNSLGILPITSASVQP